MKKVLGGGVGERSFGDDEGRFDNDTFSNSHYNKEQRTFQEVRREHMQFPQQQSFSHVSAGFAPETIDGQKQICSGFNEHNIISGTFVPSNSNGDLKVYPEEVKEQLLLKMPCRTRLNHRQVDRIPTSKQFAANSFED